MDHMQPCHIVLVELGVAIQVFGILLFDQQVQKICPQVRVYPAYIAMQLVYNKFTYENAKIT